MRDAGSAGVLRMTVTCTIHLWHALHHRLCRSLGCVCLLAVRCAQLRWRGARLRTRARVRAGAARRATGKQALANQGLDRQALGERVRE